MLGGENLAGAKLKEAGLAHWKSPNMGATNESGFTALPGGTLYYDGSFAYVWNFGCWWSSTDEDDYTAWILRLIYYGVNVENVLGRKSNGFSVRCLKDK